MSHVTLSAELETLEVELLLEGVRRQYGFDLRNHSRPLLLLRTLACPVERVPLKDVKVWLARWSYVPRMKVQP